MVQELCVLKDNIEQRNNEDVISLLKYTDFSELNDDSIIHFLDSMNYIPLKMNKEYPIFGMSGLGGSGIYKPNLSTLTCLFIASLKKVHVRKTGSKAITN